MLGQGGLVAGIDKEQVHTIFVNSLWLPDCPECDRTMPTFQTHSPSAEAFDRGPAKYFHGREVILGNFRDILWYSKQKESGTTFLIQGAPGAGKTALLAKCEELARDRGWKIVDIDPPALWNPNELQQSLGIKKIKIEGGSARVGIPSIGEAEISVGRFPQTMKTLLREGRDPLLLTLDEAQTLGKKEALPPDQAHTASSLFNAIHNGKLNKPVLLLAAGLGTTAESFRSFGISRFAKRCLVELGALDKEAERAVLYDWLTKDGNAEGDPTTWIDAIVQETHGWPQHILSYVEPALDQLHAAKGEVTEEGLNAVLKEGRAGRAAYYEQRVDDFRGDQIRCIAKSVAGIAPGEPVEYRDIVSSLTIEYGDREAKHLFQRFLKKGILEKCGTGYAVSIPSMHSWLENEYAREQIKLPRGMPPIRSLKERSSGMDLDR